MQHYEMRAAGILNIVTTVRAAGILSSVIPAAFSPRESGEGIQWL
jgi:hypothetical protein